MPPEYSIFWRQPSGVIPLDGNEGKGGGVGREDARPGKQLVRLHTWREGDKNVRGRRIDGWTSRTLFGDGERCHRPYFLFGVGGWRVNWLVWLGKLIQTRRWKPWNSQNVGEIMKGT